MAGKRLKKRDWRRAPAVLAVMAASAVLLTPAGSAGAATGARGGAAAVAEGVPTSESGAAAAVREGAGSAAPAVQEGVEAPAAGEPEDGAAAEEEAPFAPVPESEAVEDAYFEDAVFLGDSRTEGFRLYSGLKKGTYLCSVGATVESVFTRKDWPAGGREKVPLLDALKEIPCGKVYLMLGVNELGWNRAETYRSQYAKLIDRIREDHPEAVIVLQTLLPVSARQDAKGSYVNNERIRVYNGIIRALAEEKDCALVETAEALTGEDGCLPGDLNFDGVHLNPKGCRIWLEYLRTHSVAAEV